MKQKYILESMKYGLLDFKILLLENYPYMAAMGNLGFIPSRYVLVTLVIAK